MKPKYFICNDIINNNVECQAKFTVEAVKYGDLLIDNNKEHILIILMNHVNELAKQNMAVLLYLITHFLNLLKQLQKN